MKNEIKIKGKKIDIIFCEKKYKTIASNSKLTGKRCLLTFLITGNDLMFCVREVCSLLFFILCSALMNGEMKSNFEKAIKIWGKDQKIDVLMNYTLNMSSQFVHKFHFVCYGIWLDVLYTLSLNYYITNFPLIWYKNMIIWYNRKDISKEWVIFVFQCRSPNDLIWTLLLCAIYGTPIVFKCDWY